MKKNDAAWQSVFSKRRIIQELAKNKYFYVTADEIRAAGAREPRLMAKQDTLESRPAIFRDKRLSRGAGAAYSVAHASKALIQENHGAID